MAEPNAGLYWLLELRLRVTAAHSLGSCSGSFVSRNSVRGTQTVTRSRRYLILLKPDRVDILQTVKRTIVDNDFVCV